VGRRDDDPPEILGHRTMKDLIYTALRERIVFDEMRPGERLVELISPPASR
jgi:DNA-binding GntR family transcriptional regulator